MGATSGIVECLLAFQRRFPTTELHVRLISPDHNGDDIRSSYLEFIDHLQGLADVRYIGAQSRTENSMQLAELFPTP
jgi:hypothetical protein